MSEFQTVQLRHHAGDRRIARLRLNRPQRLNAIDAGRDPRRGARRRGRRRCGPTGWARCAPISCRAIPEDDEARRRVAELEAQLRARDAGR